MEILPSLNNFVSIKSHCRRVPVAGQETVNNLTPALLYEKLFKGKPDSFLFESGKGPEDIARYSIMGASNSLTIDQNPLAGLRAMGFSVTTQIDYLSHFWGGWVGFIGYEVAGFLENLDLQKKDSPQTPDMYFVQVESLVVYDHTTKLLKYIVSKETDEAPEDLYNKHTKDIKEFWKKIDSALNEINNAPESTRQILIDSNGSGSAGELKSIVSRDQYMSMVNRAKEYISEGDIYQANLSQKFEIDCDSDPFDLYLKLRAVNPSPFAGFLNFRDFAIISSSPERLFKLENDILETRPIAGTRPRGQNDIEDESLSRELLLNAKEKAEHLMLVDLERNDLGRICEFGSVTVTDLMFLEKYSHVTHIVSNIRGKLKPDVTVLDILKATFPGGTITGCPKIRCMEIIEELEPSRRGPYSGSFGYIGFSRQMDFNIIIRTILIKNRKAWFHVGAGIVADSIAENEYQETLDKAAAMIKVLTSKSLHGK